MSRKTNSRICFLRLFCLGILLSGSHLYAQQAAPDQGQNVPSPTSTSEPDIPITTFKARTDLVLVPVVVRDKQGKHAAGLTRDAFRVEENGKDQDISLFEEVQAPTKEAPSQVVDRGYSNLPFDNAQQLRLTIIVLDLLNTTMLQREDAKDQLIKFLSKGLGGDQPISLLCLTSKDLQLVQPFTSDTSVLVAALKKLSLGYPRIMPRRNAAEKTLRQLTEIAQGYIGIPGRKSMIFAAGDIPEPSLERSVYPSDLVPSDAFHETFKNLIDANIAIYPFAILDWTKNPALDRRRTNYRQVSSNQSLLEFADATGGNPCNESNNMTKCFAEAVEDSRSYYMLGFTVRPDDRKPGWRNLKVKVSGQVNIRARNGFFYGQPAPPNPTSVHDAEINALASSLAYSAVPMYVRVEPQAPGASAGGAISGKKTTIQFTVTIPLASIRIDPAMPNSLNLEIGAIAITPETTEAAEFMHSVHGNPKPDVLRQIARDGVRLHEKLDLPLGAYDVRFMVRDNNADQIGTVVFPLEVK